MTVIPLYFPRFLSLEQYAEGINLYHLARVAGKHTRYDRLIWASKELDKKYSLKGCGSYKDLSAGIAGT